MPDPHSTENYAIGKGIMYIAEWVGDTPPDEADFVDIGNAPSVEIEPVLERLPHYSSRQDFRLKDKNPVIQTEYNLNFQLDEPAAANLKVFLMGDIQNNVIAAMTNTAREYAVKFVSDNPIGPQWTWTFWKLTISPNGPMALVSEEWMVMDFLGEGLADVDNHPNSPYFDVQHDDVSASSASSESSASTP